jgi:hypothetical protein
LATFWKNLDADDPTTVDQSELVASSKLFRQTVEKVYPELLKDFDQLRFGYEDKLILSPPRAHEDRQINGRGEVDRLWYALNESRKPHEHGRQNLGPVRNNKGLSYFPRGN